MDYNKITNVIILFYVHLEVINYGNIVIRSYTVI